MVKFPCWNRGSGLQASCSSGSYWLTVIIWTDEFWVLRRNGQCIRGNPRQFSLGDKLSIAEPFVPVCCPDGLYYNAQGPFFP